MQLPRKLLQQAVFGAGGGRRFTQDSPVMPDVWFSFGSSTADALDLLLEPRRGTKPGELRDAIVASASERLGARTWSRQRKVARVAYDESHVVAHLPLVTLVRAVLPLSGWWRTHAGRLGGLSASEIERAVEGDEVPEGVNAHGRWFLQLVGVLLWVQRQKDAASWESSSYGRRGRLPPPRAYSNALEKALAGLESPRERAERTTHGSTLWSVNRNRSAEIAIWSSRTTTKADAAERIFDLDCGHLAWAVLDTGIDARHPAFRVRDARGELRALPEQGLAHTTRVLETYDFTRIRALLDESADELPEGLGTDGQARAAELRRRLLAGQAVDWELIGSLLRIEHDTYGPGDVPEHAHGTHVAGTIGADWRVTDTPPADTLHDLRGICPTIRLFDLRVLDGSGTGDEFSILAALQFIRYLNSRSRRPAIQGVNLSFSITHDVDNYACGRTPVCDEAQRLHASGVLVVAAAGNKGLSRFVTSLGDAEDTYRDISITDPGNADAVLTVGATHRQRPHSYGVSYFSSRGPTGDGRIKPDLVAPGEKIVSALPDMGSGAMDGTSMAAPHVSGAAALIMSRHAEFIGEPARIKQILCATSTDLGRERYFQGAGLVDIARALQSV